MEANIYTLNLRGFGRQIVVGKFLALFDFQFGCARALPQFLSGTYVDTYKCDKNVMSDESIGIVTAIYGAFSL